MLQFLPIIILRKKGGPSEGYKVPNIKQGVQKRKIEKSKEQTKLPQNLKHKEPEAKLKEVIHK